MNEESITRIPLNAFEVTHHCVLNRVMLARMMCISLLYDEANRFERKNKSIKGVGN